MVGCIVGSCQKNPPKTEKQKKQEKLQEEISSLDTLIENTITEIKNDPNSKGKDKDYLYKFLNSEKLLEELFSEAKKDMEKLAKNIEDCEKNGDKYVYYDFKSKPIAEAKKELESQQKFFKLLDLIIEKSKKEKELLNSLPKKADNKQ
jgi:hypothetical protein